MLKIPKNTTTVIHIQKINTVRLVQHAGARFLDTLPVLMQYNTGNLKLDRGGKKISCDQKKYHIMRIHSKCTCTSLYMNTPHKDFLNAKIQIDLKPGDTEIMYGLFLNFI